MKGDHPFGNGLQVVLDGEVTRIQTMHLRLRQVLEVRLAAFGGEEDVFLTPEDERLRLLFAQKVLPLRIELHVGAIVVEEVQVYTRGVGTLELVQVHVPIVGADELRPTVAVK